MRSYLSTTFFLIILIITGCTSTSPPQFFINVDSISSGESNQKRGYILLSGDENINPSDLQFKEFSRYVDRALASKGFTSASSLEEANVVIFLLYGISDPQENHFSYTIPTWGRTGISSATTYGSLNTYGNAANFSSTTNFTPTYGVTGGIPISGVHTRYLRFLTLNAYDLDEYKKSETKVHLWKTEVTSKGSSGDLRQVFPILVTAAKPFIGENSGKIVEVILKEDDSRVEEIKDISKE